MTVKTIKDQLCETCLYCFSVVDSFDPCSNPVSVSMGKLWCVTIDKRKKNDVIV